MSTEVTWDAPGGVDIFTVGSVTQSAAAASASIVRRTTATITIYVDGSAGDDDNAGTPQAPVATLAAALALVPSEIRHDVLVRVVAAGTYTCPSIDRFAYAGGQLFVYGEPYTTVSSGTASSGSTTTLVTSGLVASAHRGQFIEVTFISGLVERREIQDNTTTTFTPCELFGEAVASTTTFRVIEPNVLFDVQTGLASYERVRLRGPEPPTAVRGSYSPGLTLANVKLASSTSIGVAIDGEVGFYGVVASSTVDLDCSHGALISMGVSARDQGCAAPYAAGLCPTLTAWTGYGFRSDLANGVGADGTIGNWIARGFIVTSKYGATDRSGNSHLIGGNLYGVGTSEALVATGKDSVVSVANNTPQMLISSASTIGAVRATLGGTVHLSGGTISCTGAGSAAAHADREGTVYVRQAAAVSGSGQAHGCRVRRGGKIYLTVGTTALTGGTANLAAGETATIVTAASLAADGDCIVSANGDGSVIQRAA